jgi:phosphoglycerate dehydrogenase-like enzyme
LIAPGPAAIPGPGARTWPSLPTLLVWGRGNRRRAIGDWRLYMRVVVLDDFHHTYEDSPGVARLRERADVSIYTEPATSRDELVSRLDGVPVLIANRERTPFPADLFPHLPDLELICNTGGHLYHVDVPAATAAGVALQLAYATNPETTGRSTAELTLALMHAVMRRIPQTDRALRAGEWRMPLGEVLYGKTLGIVGLGRVGRHVARLATAYGMPLLAWGPTLTPTRAAASGAEYRELDDLLAEADVVSIHLALSDQSRNLFDEARLRRMRSTAYLVNTARGAIVDEAALVRVLREHAIAGAALDVYVQEPLPADHPLLSLETAVLTPHLGWPADLTYREFAEDCADQIVSYLDGDYARVLNPEALERRARQAQRD